MSSTDWRAFWTRYGRGIIWLAIVIAAFGVAAYLSSCARPQPPCPDCWLYVPKTQPSKL